MARVRTPIVGDNVPDQRKLRPARRVKDLDQFLQFLAEMEAVFGRPARRTRRITGDKFLL